MAFSGILHTLDLSSRLLIDAHRLDGRRTSQFYIESLREGLYVGCSRCAVFNIYGNTLRILFQVFTSSLVLTRGGHCDVIHIYRYIYGHVCVAYLKSKE